MRTTVNSLFSILHNNLPLYDRPASVFKCIKYWKFDISLFSQREVNSVNEEFAKKFVNLNDKLFEEPIDNGVTGDITSKEAVVPITDSEPLIENVALATSLLYAISLSFKKNVIR